MALAVLSSALLVGCQSDLLAFPSFGSGESGAERSDAEDLPLGSWRRDNLHCAQDRCERWYAIEVEDSGILRVDLYAPVGRGLPDCEMQLETEAGDLVAARTGRVQTRRRLHHETVPGRYRLRIASKGSNHELFDFEVVAELRKGETAAAPPKPSPPTRTKSTPRKRPDIPRAVVRPATETSSSESSGKPLEMQEEKMQEEKPQEEAPRQEQATDETEAPDKIQAAIEPGPIAGPELPPPPEPRWVVAEVLDVEEADGEASAVMIEAGAPEGIGPGRQGELFEGAMTIGRIEIVDVYPSGSRARIVGPLLAPVSFDTLSRIEIPPDGE